MRLRTLLFVAAASVVFSLSVAAQSTFFAIPPAIPGAVSARDRGPNGAALFQRTAFIYPAADMAQGNIPASTAITSLGFHLDVPAAAAATGTFRLWVSQGVPDAVFTRSLAWATLLALPTPLTLVYDGPLTIPAAPGWFDVAFNQPGASLTVQPGAGYYFAYEWVATTRSSVSASYSCFNRTNTLNTATGTTAPPLLTNNSGFRPWIRLGASGGVNYPDAGVVQVYTLGQVPLLPGVAAPNQPALPVEVRARVYNGGTQVLLNLPVALAVSGPTPYAATIVLDSLRPGDTTTVRFNGFRPAVGGGHAATVSVPATNDSIRTNNSAADSLFVSARRLTYGRGYPPGETPYNTYPIGFGATAGALLVRHTLAQPAAISHIGFAVPNYAPNVGRTVFAVLLDSAGQPLAPLVPHVILATELGEFVRFALPAPVRVRGVFFAGVGQPAGAPGQADFYPVGGQTEGPVLRDSAYYAVYGDLLLLGQTPPQEYRADGRLVIAVDLVADPRTAVAPPAAVTAAALVVWPNPAHQLVRLRGAAPGAAVVVLDGLGRTARRATTSATGEATLDVAALPPGVYTVRVGAAARRVVVE